MKSSLSKQRKLRGMMLGIGIVLGVLILLGGFSFNKNISENNKKNVEVSFKSTSTSIIKSFLVSS